MSTTSRRVATAAVATSLAVGLAAAGCGSSTSTDSASTTAKPAGTTAGTVAAGVAVTDAWARTSAVSATAGAVYLTLTSAAGDTLTGVSVPSSVAKDAQLHETVMGGSSGTTPGTAMTGGTTMGTTKATSMGSTTTAMSGTTTGTEAMGGTEGTAMPGTTMAGSGEMSMKEIDELALPPGEAVQLEPGGYHIMLMDLAAPLKAGEQIPITLTFAKAGEQQVTATVRDS